jgi:hypothetical protein
VDRPKPKDSTADALRAFIRELENRNVPNITPELLERWLDGRPAALDSDVHFEAWKAMAPLEFAALMESWKTVIESGQTALKSLMTINGGAAVALLAFLGNLLTKEPPNGATFPIQVIATAMVLFVGGVASGGAALVFRYFTQFYARRNEFAMLEHKSAMANLRIPQALPKLRKAAERVSYVAMFLAWITGFGSLGVFCWGGWKAFRAIHG